MYCREKRLNKASKRRISQLTKSFVKEVNFERLIADADKTSAIPADYNTPYLIAMECKLDSNCV